MRKFRNIRLISIFLSLMFLATHTGVSSLLISQISESKSPKKDACQTTCCCAPGNCHCEHHETPSGQVLSIESPDCSPIKKAASLFPNHKDVPISPLITLICPILTESHNQTVEKKIVTDTSSPPLFRPPISQVS